MWVTVTLSFKFETRERLRNSRTLNLNRTFKSWKEIRFWNLVEFTPTKNRRTQSLKLDFKIKSIAKRIRTRSKVDWSEWRNFETLEWNQHQIWKARTWTFRIVNENRFKRRRDWRTLILIRSWVKMIDESKGGRDQTWRSKIRDLLDLTQRERWFNQITLTKHCWSQNLNLRKAFQDIWSWRSTRLKGRCYLTTEEGIWRSETIDILKPVNSCFKRHSNWQSIDISHWSLSWTQIKTFVETINWILKSLRSWNLNFLFTSITQISNIFIWIFKQWTSSTQILTQRILRKSIIFRKRLRKGSLNFKHCWRKSTWVQEPTSLKGTNFEHDSVWDQRY